jgi:hypothetical protein
MGAVALAGLAGLRGMFRALILEKQMQGRRGLVFPLEVVETQAVQVILQRRVRLGITFRVVPQGLAGLAVL